MDRRFTSPTWGPPPPCQQALKQFVLNKTCCIKKKQRELAYIGINQLYILSITAQLIFIFAIDFKLKSSEESNPPCFVKVQLSVEFYRLLSRTEWMPVTQCNFFTKTKIAFLRTFHAASLGSCLMQFLLGIRSIQPYARNMGTFHVHELF